MKIITGEDTGTCFQTDVALGIILKLRIFKPTKWIFRDVHLLPISYVLNADVYMYL